MPAWVFAAVAGRVTGTRPPNLFLTLARHRPLFWGWLMFAGRLMPGGRLRRRESELCILRVAHLRDCRYEFEHHVRLGRRAGVTEADVERLVAGPGRARLVAARGGHAGRGRRAARRRRTSATRPGTRLRAHLDEREAIELCMLAGHYQMLATVIAALRIQPDSPARG